MRTSLLALLLLVLVGGLGYAYSSGNLPAPAEQAVTDAATWVRSLTTSTAEQQPKPQEGQRQAARQGNSGQGGGAGQGGGRQGGRSLTVPVEVAQALSTPSESAIRSIGSLASDESVEVSAEQAGRISDIRFREGDRVVQGTVLVKLDDAVIQAELADARSRLVLAEGNFKRATTLSQSGAGTARALDEARSAMETARAAVDLAQTRLSKTEITAPFSGLVGLRKSSIGAFVQTGQAIVNLEKIDVLKVDFKVPENLLAQVRVGQNVEIAVDAYPARTFAGTIYAIDPLVDVNGRALSVRARLDNADELLRPGLFARVTLRRSTTDRVVIVPEGAVVPRANGVVVFRVVDGKAVETPVQLGERRAGAVEVISGVNSDETVIVAGHTRLRNGASVEVVQTPQPRTAG